MADQIGEDYIQPDGNLPGDVMVIILSYLPVKSLLKCKSVCKSWCSLISSPFFIKKHLNRQSLIANTLLLTWDNNNNNNNTVIDLTLLSHNNNYDDKKNCVDCDISTSKLLPLLSSLEEDVNVLGSCKGGLVCLWPFSCGKLVLWNPATRRYRYFELPDFKELSLTAFGIIGLGYVEATNDYKILGWASTRPSMNVMYMLVYTLSSDSWKELDNYDAKSLPFQGWTESTTFINGCMNWLSNTFTCNSDYTCSNYVYKIFAFDVDKEVMFCFGGVPLYNKPGSRVLRQTLVIRNCLSIVILPESEAMECGIEIWVMAEYGVEESWVKQFTIQGLTTVELPPLKSWRDSEIIFMCKEEGDLPQKLMFYDLCSKKMTFLEVGLFNKHSLRVFDYVESLASVQ